MAQHYLRVTGAADPDDPGIDHLWLLVAANQSCEGGRCFGLPHSNRITGAEDLMAACEQANSAGFPDVTAGQIFDAWKSYRSGRRLLLPSPENDPEPDDDRIPPIRFAIDPSLGLVSYTVTGHVRKNDAKEFLDAVLTDPDFRRGFNFIGDRREMATTRGDEYARAVAALVEANRGQLAPCRWAVLVPNPVAYGMARMWSLIACDTDVSIQPFYELNEAIEWLGLPNGCRPELITEEMQSKADTRW